MRLVVILRMAFYLFEKRYCGGLGGGDLAGRLGIFEVSLYVTRNHGVFVFLFGRGHSVNHTCVNGCVKLFQKLPRFDKIPYSSRIPCQSRPIVSRRDPP